MSIATYVFAETSPSAPGAAPSALPVTGDTSSYLPAGVAGVFEKVEAIDVVAELVGATGGPLDVYVQVSPNQGATWYDVVHFPQLAAGAAAVIYRAPLSLYATAGAPTVAGKGLVPTLAAGAVVNGALLDRMRLVMVAGAGTSAGAPVLVTMTAQGT